MAELADALDYVSKNEAKMSKDIQDLPTDKNTDEVRQNNVPEASKSTRELAVELLRQGIEAGNVSAAISYLQLAVPRGQAAQSLRKTSASA